MKIKKLLLRLGSKNLIKFIDDDIYKILKIRNKSIGNQKNLSYLILKLNSEERIIKNSKTRELLFGVLKEFEASLIAKLFNIKSNNPWKSLSTINFNNKKNINLLLNVFDIKQISDSENILEENKVNPVPIKPTYSMFPHQIDVLKKTKNFLRKDPKRCIMHMPTGSGKTRTAINLICDHLKNNNKLVIWLAHTEELCQQAHDEFNKGWETIGNREIQSYKLFKNFRYDLDKIKDGFLVMSLDYAYSLTKKNQNQFFKLARSCEFVVMDEAHMSVAPSYKQVLEILVNNNTNLLGLTATPGRAEILDDENIKLAEFFNRQKSTLKVKGYKSPIHYLESKGSLAKVENVRLEANINFSKIFTKSEIRSQLLRLQNGLDLSKEFIKKISSNEKRINMIIEAAIKKVKK